MTRDRVKGSPRIALLEYSVHFSFDNHAFPFSLSFPYKRKKSWGEKEIQSLESKNLFDIHTMKTNF